MCIGLHLGDIEWTISYPPKDLSMWKCVSAETMILFASDHVLTVTLLIEALIFVGCLYPA